MNCERERLSAVHFGIFIGAFQFHAKIPCRKFEQTAKSGNCFHAVKCLQYRSLSDFFYDFFKTISVDEVENLRIYAILMHRSGFSGSIFKELSFFV